MGKNIAKWCIACLGVIAIPYLLTLILSGAPISGPGGKEATVQVGEQQASSTGSYSLEEYLMTAMAANVSSDFEMETLKAQAIILRTIVYQKLASAQQKGSSNSLTTEELGIQTMTMEELQNTYEGEDYSTFVSNLENAIYSTKGQIITYGGAPIQAYFHYANTGQTRAYESKTGETLPYLISVKSDWDIEASVAVNTTEYELSYVIQMLEENYQITSLTKDSFFDQISISSRDETGYVKELKIGDATISGEEFADTFALNSTNFYIDNYDGNMRVVCKGKGNGLGFSQYGANSMAKEGKTYETLLFYYYPDTILSQVEE